MVGDNGGQRGDRASGQENNTALYGRLAPAVAVRSRNAARGGRDA